MRWRFGRRRGVPRHAVRHPRRAARVVMLLLAAASLSGCASAKPSVGVATPVAAASAPVPPTTSTSLRPAVRTSTPVATAVPGAPPVSQPLAGKIIGIDPGHNGRNYSDPAYIDHLIWNGREQEACDTTGTETDGGYTEARFNFNVARYLAGDLRDDGAAVVLTRTSDAGVGPCVDRRSQIINEAHADVALDIHADGGPPQGRGFTVLEPVADGPNDGVIGASRRFGRDLRERFRSLTGMPESTYDGTDAISPRDNLAGLNLTTVPKVLIECGNMRNSVDASRLITSSFQRAAARAMALAIVEFLQPRS